MSQSNKKVKNVLCEHNSTRLTNGNTFKNILLLAIKKYHNSYQQNYIDTYKAHLK